MRVLQNILCLLLLFLSCEEYTKKEKTTSQHELFSKYDSLEERDWIDLASYCESKNIEFGLYPNFKSSFSSLINLNESFSLPYIATGIPHNPILE